MENENTQGSSCNGCPQNNEDVKQKMLLQLHEQYAVNNNSGLSSIVSLIVGMFVAIGFYGYAYVYCTNEFDTRFCYSCCCSCSFSLTQLSIIAILSLLVLAIIIHICIYQGTDQRLEQFIIHQIRKKYGIVDQNEISEILPSSYKPSGKRGLRIVQGLYGEIVKISAALELFIIVSLLVRYTIYFVPCFECLFSKECVIVAFVIFWFVYLASRSIYFLYKRENLYLKREEEYRQKESANKNQTSDNAPIKEFRFGEKRTFLQTLKIFKFLFCYKNLNKKHE